MSRFNIIAAMEPITRGIGYKNKLPFESKIDLQYFKKITTGSTCIMGRNTFESIPKKLSNRNTIVISNKMQQNDNCLIVPNFHSALELSKCLNTKTFVIGGETVYQEAISHPLCDKIYLTKIFTKNDNYDRYFPEIPRHFKLINSEMLLEKNNQLMFEEYQSTFKNEEERQYLLLLKEILETGVLKPNRTNIPTKSLFSKTLQFSLKDDKIPLMTTKKMFFRGIVEELLFFLSGSTNTNILRKKGIHFWNDNTSLDFLKSRNLNYKQGDMGPTYSFLFRHQGMGHLYQGMNTNYYNMGFDQVQYVIDELKNNPNSRRIMINLWDPYNVDKMTLPPCMFNYLFNVIDNELHLQVTIRSSDTFLGLPFNICTGALLVRMLCNETGLEPGNLHINLGDTHIYENHIEQVTEQTTRIPFDFPTLKLKQKPFFEYEYSDFILEDYKYHEKISGKMAI